MFLIKVEFIVIVCFIQNISCKPKIQHPHRNVDIIGGHSISIHQVPFMASLRLNGTYHWCGASIIHEQFVLTAAHCIVPDREFKVLVGTDLVDKGGELYETEKIINHELYSKKTDDYDICIIKLKTPLKFGPKVGKIDLADKGTKIKKGAFVEVTGWGNTKPSSTISEKLLQVSIPVVASRSCQRSYFSALRKLTARMMCAGGNGRDSCQGDSGGPLTLDNVQVGVTSFGVGCGVLPGVYTKVGPLLPWILETIEQNTSK